MKSLEAKWYVLALSLLQPLTGILGPLLANGVDPEAMYHASSRELSRRWGMSSHAAGLTVTERERVDFDIERSKLKAEGACIVCLIDDEYPRSLRSAPTPPPILYVKGTIPTEPAVAVVGARKASSYGLTAAGKIATELAEAGVTIVSGLALGIDGAAHKAALAAGGKTIAVMGCGIDICYPRRHEALIPEIVASGCIISEFPIGTPPLRHHFPMRNRIISGLSVVTVVVEAAVNSGSLYTADFALAQGREVLAVPGPISSPLSAGTNALLADGAGPARSAEDVFDVVGLEPPERTVARRERLSEEESVVLDLLSSEPLTVDEIVARKRASAAEVAAIMTLLEVKGVVRRGMDQRYSPAII